MERKKLTVDETKRCTPGGNAMLKKISHAKHHQPKEAQSIIPRTQALIKPLSVSMLCPKATSGVKSTVLMAMAFNAEDDEGLEATIFISPGDVRMMASFAASKEQAHPQGLLVTRSFEGRFSCGLAISVEPCSNNITNKMKKVQPIVGNCLGSGYWVVQIVLQYRSVQSIQSVAS